MASIVYVIGSYLYRVVLISMAAIHGDKQQNERDWVLGEFKSGKSPIMVATDVASRGIGMTPSSPVFPLHSYPRFAIPCL